MQENREGRPTDVKYILPPGYNFSPSDGDALKHYVLPKAHGEDKYPELIKDLDIYQFEPQALPGFMPEKPSFYYSRRDLRHANGSRVSRVTKGGKGFWRITSKITEVKDSDGSLLGRKNTLNYMIKNEDGSKTKTDYLMQEYVLDNSRCSGELNDVVLCKIYHKKSSMGTDGQAVKAEESSRQTREEQVEQARVEEKESHMPTSNFSHENNRSTNSKRKHCHGQVPQPREAKIFRPVTSPRNLETKIGEPSQVYHSNEEILSSQPTIINVNCFNVYLPTTPKMMAIEDTDFSSLISHNEFQNFYNDLTCDKPQVNGSSNMAVVSSPSPIIAVAPSYELFRSRKECHIKIAAKTAWRGRQ